MILVSEKEIKNEMIKDLNEIKEKLLGCLQRIAKTLCYEVDTYIITVNKEHQHFELQCFISNVDIDFFRMEVNYFIDKLLVSEDKEEVLASFLKELKEEYNEHEENRE